MILNLDLTSIGSKPMGNNNTLYHLTFSTNSQSLVHYENMNSMSFPVDSGVQFLDCRPVAFVFSLHQIIGSVTEIQK